MGVVSQMDQFDLQGPAVEQDVLLECTYETHPDPVVAIPSPARNPYDGDESVFILSATKSDLKSRYPAEYNSHRAMLQREKRGFTVHADFRDFRAFLICVGPMPSVGYTLDRIDFSDPEYAPGKVRWADKVTQNSNKSDTLTYACSRTGQTFTTSELALRLKIKPDTIRKRKSRYGWTDDEIIQDQKLPQQSSEKVSIASPSRPQATAKKVDEDKRNAYAVGEQWKHTVAATCGTFELMPSHRDLSRAKVVISELGQDKVARIVSAVVPSWSRFSHYVKEHDGLPRHSPVPRHPNFRFVFCDHPQAAVNFAFDKDQQRQMEQERERETMLIEYRKAHGLHTSFTPAGMELRKWWAEQQARQRTEFAQML